MKPDLGRGAKPPLWRTVLPAPGLSTLLLATWLMLNESVSAGNILLGLALALALPLFTHRRAAGDTSTATSKTTSNASRATPRHGLRALPVATRLAAVVLWDIVRANLDVARRVLGAESALQPRFVWVPLALRNPQAVVVLAGIVTLTPGTVSSQVSADRQHLLVHALHCPDEAALVAEIKARYEAPLLELLG